MEHWNNIFETGQIDSQVFYNKSDFEFEKKNTIGFELEKKTTFFEVIFLTILSFWKSLQSNITLWIILLRGIDSFCNFCAFLKCMVWA